MSTITTLVNNYDLILEHRLEVMAYPPYCFSKVRFPSLRKHNVHAVESPHTSIWGSHLGSYLMIWENFEKRWPDSDVIPFRAVGSPLSGRIAQFIGYSKSTRSIITEAPQGFTTGAMRRYVARFRELFPERLLCIPLEEVVAELKAGGQMQSRPSYQLLELRKNFYQLLSIMSGIEPDGPAAISYSLNQNYKCQPAVKIDVLIEGQRRASGNAVVMGYSEQAEEQFLESKRNIEELALGYGLAVSSLERGHLSSQISCMLLLDRNETVMQKDTMEFITAFVHEAEQMCNRF